MMLEKTVLLFCAGITLMLLLDPVIASCAIVPSAVILFLPEYRTEQKKARMAKDAPKVMYQFSILSSFLSYEKALEESCKTGGEFARELAKALNRIKKGESVRRALKTMLEKNPWSEKEVLLLLACYEKGGNVSNVVREAAENALEDQRLEEEKNASILVEKYTLLIAAGLLVPGLLGMTFSTVSALDLGGLEGMGMPALEKAEMKQALLNANQVYVPVLAALAAVFLAGQEKQKILLYSSVLVPVSLAVFRTALTTRLL